MLLFTKEDHIRTSQQQNRGRGRGRGHGRGRGRVSERGKQIRPEAAAALVCIYVLCMNK